jgi:ribulose-5-phosphate 4-epimerase/fuculose-1-phosphate aldolase
MTHSIVKAACAAAALFVASLPCASFAQQPTAPVPATTPAPATTPMTGGPVAPAAIDDLVAAGRILVDQGVLDGFGHVSMRHPSDPNRFLMSRSLAPALVTADDVMEFDLDSNAVDLKGRTTFLERFIHGEIYKSRPDVMSVVHSHAPSVIPFTVSQVPMKAMFHNSAFLAPGVPVFEIRKSAGMTNMLVGSGELGKALATTLADKSVVLMRGHGYVATGPTVPIAVFRAVYTEVNARLQQSAIALGGPFTTLELEEGVKADKVNEVISARPWDLWRRKALAK